jgi:hypothetical protein
MRGRDAVSGRTHACKGTAGPAGRPPLCVICSTCSNVVFQGGI